MTQRIIALIDGFNFYHPIKHHQNQLGICLQWLDYSQLLSYYVKRSRLHPEGKIEQIYFFSALAYWRNSFAPGTTDRHLTYINALKYTGIQVVLGHFKEKRQQFPYRCDHAKTHSVCQIKKVAH